MIDFKDYLNLNKENYAFVEAYDNNPKLTIACFVHWMIENVDLNKVNIFIWA